MNMMMKKYGDKYKLKEKEFFNTSKKVFKTKEEIKKKKSKQSFGNIMIQKS